MGLLRQEQREDVLDRYIWGDKCLTLFRCATCGCVTQWQPIEATGDRMGVNFRNFDRSLTEAIPIQRRDGANT